MSKKSEFIEWVEQLIAGQEEPIEPSENAKIYWEAFKDKQEVEKPMFTDNGKLILKYLQDNPDIEMAKAKDIGEGLFISSRAVNFETPSLKIPSKPYPVGSNVILKSNKY